MSLYREEGVVLRTYKLGEADRIVVFMTAGRGKVRAVAKGVRKTKTRFGGRLEPLFRVSLMMHKGRELDVVTQVETLEHFAPVRVELARLADAMALVEAVDHVAREGESDARLYQMLVRGLRTLAQRPSPLLVGAFYWKLLALEGLAPNLDSCARCPSAGLGSAGDDELVALDLEEGGMICRACRVGPRAAKPAVSPEALGVIRRVLGGELGKALAEPAGPTAVEVTELGTRALEAHLERRLRTLRAFAR